jgi:hypothetical protein
MKRWYHAPPMSWRASWLCCVAAAMAAGGTGCTHGERKVSMEHSSYTVCKTGRPVPADATWESPSWAAAKPLELRHFMGEEPLHFPRTQARLLYDDRFLYVIFRVEDRYVRAVAREHQGPVWRDSCVEFFFTPGPDPAAGYFNLEMNCGGTMLMRFQKVPRNGRWIEPEDLDTIRVSRMMPRIVDPEIAEPVVWSVSYRLPVEMLGRYCSRLQRPASGVTWRANFYKCGDDTSHPHWLTWAPVRHPEPDFHRPEYFGILVFE